MIGKRKILLAAVAMATAMSMPSTAENTFAKEPSYLMVQSAADRRRHRLDRPKPDKYRHCAMPYG